MNGKISVIKGSFWSEMAKATSFIVNTHHVDNVLASAYL
jgi:hypothetical protein